MRHPIVSVIVPAVNEESTLEQALAPLLSDPNIRDLEVLVAVGPSTDRTRELVIEMSESDSRVRLIDNPERVTPAGLNRAIRASRGAVILRMDGHAVPAVGYVSACLAILRATDAWNVGGTIQKVGQTPAARAAAAAASTSFGIGGGARYHLAVEAQDVDTLWPGCWPRWVFERVGLFDPEMVQNQDDEFNQRILEAGGRVRFDPSISATYFARGTWRGLFRQYYRYGFYKVRGFQKHPASLRARHLVPSLTVIAVPVSLAISVSAPPVGLALIAIGAIAWLASATLAARTVVTTFGTTIPHALVAFACLHASYGCGTLVGIVRFGPRWFIDRSGTAPTLEPLLDEEAAAEHAD